ncbi:MAG: 2-amino-4-hydroxy-6-hydroxymethyldihydropteridine diphosphokinase [Chitinivibrionales bacterium]|nr:2-amino-4-hydroxy-6-hydroxymethyldihydropteridine diphosphokinase [Chitinivibrionales bacterium]
MNRVAISLGANIGERACYLRTLLDKVARVLQGPLLVSALMETEPLETETAQAWYFNRLLSGRFLGSAPELVKECLRIESECGRRRPFKNAPRTADVDVLLFGDLVSKDPACTIPHPRFLDRRFCLEGLYQIAAQWIVPTVNQPIGKIYAEMPVSVRRQKIIFYEQ